MNNCNDCDNCTDGVCCHQAIRNSTEVLGDDLAIKREFDRIQNRQELAKRNKHQPLYGVLVDLRGE